MQAITTNHVNNFKKKNDESFCVLKLIVTMVMMRKCENKCSQFIIKNLNLSKELLKKLYQ